MFSCQKCDSQYPKWTGRCTSCGAWGTIAEEDGAQAPSLRSSKSGKKAKAAPVLDLGSAAEKPIAQNPTGLSEVDRVLGGGIVPGSVTLLAGEPGIGKSTLVAMLCGALAKNGANAYYASGEESEGQVRLRFKRLSIDPAKIAFSNAVDAEAIIAAAESISPTLLVVDSIQTLFVEAADALPGTPNAVRAATSTLIGYAKRTGVPVLIIGQVTKDGNVAGPKTLEHLVDTVLTLEGDPASPYRLLRAAKHRFGSTEEVGVFEMTEAGLMAVDNPSSRFLSERSQSAGSAIACVMEGNRPFLVEVQALVDRSFLPAPIRRTSGYDASRLQLILAILSKRAGVRLGDQDVYINVVGGLKVSENGADLAIAAALLSAHNDKQLPADSVYIGELGLGGEIRSVPFIDRRIKEAERLGMKTIHTPKTVRNIGELK
ncbi:DNA repair protein RadA [Patescibacteria group bacterium]|nr:DNA repair protein RadA [Patescibacteria group bacterium]